MSLSRLLTVGVLSLLLPINAHTDTDSKCKTSFKRKERRERESRRLPASESNSMRQAAAQYAVPYELLVAIAWVESSNNPNRINTRTLDYGLMQINHRTARAFGHEPKSMLEPAKSIEFAAQLLATYKQKYGHESNWACRYNVGTHPNASKWGSCHKYMEKLKAAGYSI